MDFMGVLFQDRSKNCISKSILDNLISMLMPVSTMRNGACQFPASSCLVLLSVFSHLSVWQRVHFFVLIQISRLTKQLLYKKRFIKITTYIKVLSTL